MSNFNVISITVYFLYRFESEHIITNGIDAGNTIVIPFSDRDLKAGKIVKTHDKEGNNVLLFNPSLSPSGFVLYMVSHSSGFT